MCRVRGVAGVSIVDWERSEGGGNQLSSYRTGVSRVCPGSPGVSFYRIIKFGSPSFRFNVPSRARARPSIVLSG